MRFFRWGYLIPRLLLLFVLLVGSEYGLAWLVEYSVRSGGQAAAGARVDVAKSEASLLQTAVVLSGIQVANRDEPMTNLVEADHLELDFDSAALLRKQAVVKYGAIRGLRFGTTRIASGELPASEAPPQEDSPAWSASPLTDAAAERARLYLDGLGERFTDDLQDQFKSVKVAQDLRAKWPGKYDEIAVAARQVRVDAQQLKDEVAAARKNPLRHTALLQSLPTRVAALEQQLKALHAELKALPGQIESDRQAIAVARQHDEKLIRETLRVDAIDPAALSAYLLGEEIAGPMRELIGWLRWARQMAPARGQQVVRERGRGVDVLFAGLKRRPNLLIEKLDLSGTVRVGGRSVELAGRLTDFTTEPNVHGRPVQFAINTSGAMPMKLRAVIDRTTSVARDELLANCDGLVIPKLNLGGKKFSLATEPSPAALSVSLLLEGEQLSGDVQLVQSKIRFTHHAGASDASAPVELVQSAIRTNLEKLPTVVTRVSLSGTLDEPMWGLSSNLGPAVAGAMETAIAGAVDQQTERLLAASQKEVDAQLAKFNEELAAATARVEPLLSAPNDLLKQIAGAAPGASQFGKLGGAIPGAAKLLK